MDAQERSEECCVSEAARLVQAARQRIRRVADLFSRSGFHRFFRRRRRRRLRGLQVAGVKRLDVRRDLFGTFEPANMEERFALMHQGDVGAADYQSFSVGKNLGFLVAEWVRDKAQHSFSFTRAPSRVRVMSTPL